LKKFSYIKFKNLLDFILKFWIEIEFKFWIIEEIF